MILTRKDRLVIHTVLLKNIQYGTLVNDKNWLGNNNKKIYKKQNKCILNYKLPTHKHTTYINKWY